jgi:hypothetical protein
VVVHGKCGDPTGYVSAKYSATTLVLRKEAPVSVGTQIRHGLGSDKNFYPCQELNPGFQTIT